jgi:hypothetical protein
MTPTECPKCKADLRGADIPPSQQGAYGGETHFTRVIGIYDRYKDRTTHWRCPDCGHEWERK